MEPWSTWKPSASKGARSVLRRGKCREASTYSTNTRRIRFIEVKGRRTGAETVTITRNEILTALNTPEAFILALVEVGGGKARSPRYVHHPFSREPDFGVTSVNYNLSELLVMSEDAR